MISKRGAETGYWHAKLEQKAKPEFLATGKWESTCKGNPDVRGFHVSQLYSFTVNAGELVTAYLRGFGDEWAATEFWNSKLGLPYVGAGAQVTEQMIQATFANYSMNDLRPSRSGRLITMGADQGDTCHIVIAEWFLDGDASKDLSAAAKCKVLFVEKFPSEDYHHFDELMHEWQVLFAVPTSGVRCNEAFSKCREWKKCKGKLEKKAKPARCGGENRSTTGVCRLSWTTDAYRRDCCA